MRGIGVPAISCPHTNLNIIPQKFLLSGVTLDSAGAILGSCTVQVFRTADSVLVGQTISDATTGAWTVEVSGSPGATFFANFYKVGSPDVFATTLNSLVGTAT